MTASSDATDRDHGNGVIRPLRDGIDTARSQLTDAAELAREKAAKAVEAAKESLGHAKESLEGAYASGRGKTADALATGRDTAVDALYAGRDKANDVYASGRERANEAYALARQRAKAAGESASETLGASPLVALAGSLAVGVVLGTLLPRTERETRLLGGIGAKLNDLAKEALDAAKDAGHAKLAEIGLTPDKARESLNTLIDGAMAAATSAGSAAVDKARAKPAR